MFARIFFFLLGFGLTILGFTHIITYCNLFTIGYNLEEYVNFIIRRIECWNAIVGIIIMLLTIFWPGGKKDELYIRYPFKF